MAIVTSMWLKGSKKRLGGTVIYQAMGQTRQRELAADVSNPRTTSQMTQRVKWANLVNFYRANKSWMKYAFETKKQTQSEYNKFMSLNVSSSTIYLTQQQASAGACIGYPYMVTQGSLPSIEFLSADNEFQSNIYLSNPLHLDDGVSVGTLTQDLLAVNPGLREGDQLSLIRVTQQVNSDTGIPYIVVRTYEMLLDSQESKAWNLFLPSDIIGASTNGSQDLISVFGNENSGGFAMILSRTIDGKTYVSTQRMITVNNEALITSYSTNTQLAAAIASYGESEDAFLSAISANQNIQAPTQASILGFSFGGQLYVTGRSQTLPAAYAGTNIHIVFNRRVTFTPSSVTFDVRTGPFTLEDLQVSGQEVVGKIPNDALPETSTLIDSIEVVDTNGTRYQAEFGNEGTGGGIE